jgi:hypothetical protein
MADIFDFGYSVDLTMPTLLGDPVAITNSFTDGLPSSSLGSGELIGNQTVVDGYLQSGNFVTGVSGWQLTPTSAEFPAITISGGTLKYGKTSFTDSTNAGYILDNNGVYFGSASDAKYIKYAVGTGAFTLKGDLTITGGSGISNLTDAGALATADDVDFSTQVTGVTKPADNATVGADWSTNLSNIPATLGTPSADGLYLSSTYLGYYKTGAWTSFIKNNGDFYFSGDAGSHIDWNVTTPSTLTIQGNIQATAGSVIATSYLSGTVGLSNTNISAQGWTNTCAFSATDYNTIAWGAGTFTTAGGTAYSIDAGNTGNMAAATYIYLDIAVSTTVLQTTTTAATAVGSGKVLIATAAPNTDITSKAGVQVFGGIGGHILLVDNIAANSASTNEFVSNTAQIANLVVTNAKINDLAVSKLTTGTITSKEITLAVAAGTGDVKIQAGKTDFTNTDAGFILGMDDSDGDKPKFYVGDATTYLNWDGTGLAIKGSITITGGSGIGSLTDAGDLATADDVDFSTQVTGATKPEDNATVGATWGTNLSNIPATLSTPSGAGLYLSSTNLGYYDGGAWKTYMDSSGNFYLGGTGGSLTWAAGTTTLTIDGQLMTGSMTIGDGTDNGTITFDFTDTKGDAYIASGKTDFTNTDAGFILGIDDSDSNKSKFFIGDSSVYFNWDGTALTIDGATLSTPTITALQAGSEIAIQGWQSTLVFSATDNDTVAWASGAITLMDGTVYSITGANTGNMAALTYVYLDIAVSTTLLQVTTTAATAVGSGKILVAVAQNVVAGKDAEFQVFGGAGGVSKLLTADNIAADTITANEIAANTITGTEIASLNISTKTITADTGTIGGWTLGTNSLTADTGVTGLSSAVTGGTDWRIWAGNATPASAPFRVDESGNLYANSANIGGYQIDFAGTGADGALNVTSGTTNISTNQIYQYTSVSVSGGALLSTASTSNGIIMIKCQGNFTNAGEIDFDGKIADLAASTVYIRGALVTLPYVRAAGAGGNGGNGMYMNSATPAQSSAGGSGAAASGRYAGGGGGGGGSGGSKNAAPAGGIDNGGDGAAGGVGGTTPGGGGGGSAGTAPSGSGGTGTAGTQRAGGGGGGGGAGGTAANGGIGGNGGTSGAGSDGGNGDGDVGGDPEDDGGGGGGGGGCGGISGLAGCHFYANIGGNFSNTGSVNTYGSAATTAGKGGDGGDADNIDGYACGGSGGGGGGGGGSSDGGHISVLAVGTVTAGSTSAIKGARSAGGTGGIGGVGDDPGQNGSNGTAGNDGAGAGTVTVTGSYINF